MTIQIQQRTRFTASWPVEDDYGNISHELDGKSWKFTLKELSDKVKGSDDNALIVKTGTVTDGYINLDLSVDDTDLQLKKYKSDFRIFTDATDPVNTTRFEIEIVDIVTQEE